MLLRILIADDSSDDRAEIRRLLLQRSDRTFTFTEAETGAAAVRSVRAMSPGVPDCVLLDYALPDMDAPEVIAELLNEDGAPVCPIVVITGGVGTEPGRAVLRAGAQDYIGKDWLTPQGLIRAIENAAERWAMARDLREKESALRGDEARFRLIVASAAVGLATIALEGRFVEVNDAFCHIHGYERHELLGMTIRQLTHPEDFEADWACVQQLHSGERLAYTLEKRNFHKSGATIWVNYAVSLERRRDGEPVRLISAVHDITDRKLAEQRLFDTSQRLQTLLDALPVGVSFSDDASCERITGNPAVLAQFAVSPVDNLSASAPDPTAPGRQVQFFHAGRSVKDSELPLQRAVAENRVIPPMELEVLLPDGRRWFAEASAAPVHNAHGAVTAGVAVTLDITGRKLAEAAAREKGEQLLAAENRVADLVRGMSEACFALDPEWRFTFVNDRSESLLKSRRDEMLGRTIWDVFGKLVGTPMEGHYRRAMRELAPVAFEAFSPIAERWLDIRLFPTRDGLAAFLLDIQDRKRAEEGLKQLNAELEERVTKRTAQLQEANKELEAFSYSVSHDMRAPLRAIDGFSRILREDYEAKLPPDARDCLQEIGSNAKQMGRLIDDLLAFSRLSRQALQKTDVSAGALVRQCIADLSKGQPAEFRVGALPHCSADPALLKQVWMNLLGNAIKYSRSRKAPVIEIGARSGEREMIYYVKDNGVGFDMRYVHKLFGVFQRLHRQEDFEGTGVGLAIVQRVVHRHGGRVWAEGQPDSGATFYFSLPLEGALA